MRPATINETREELKRQGKIFAYMYCTGHEPSGEIIEISADVLEYTTFLSHTNSRLQVPLFIYVWGMPGPDYNTYYFSDYGKTWAFTREELL